MAWTNCQFLVQLSYFSTVGPFGPGHPRFLQAEPSDPRNIRRRTSNIQQRPTSHNHEQQQRQQQHCNRLQFADDKLFVNTTIDPGEDVQSHDWKKLRFLTHSAAMALGSVGWCHRLLLESTTKAVSLRGICRKPYFGVKGGERVFLKILGNGESVSSLEDAREELSFSFAELEDFALENRSICFNSLDRKQMDELNYLFIILSMNEQN